MSGNTSGSNRYIPTKRFKIGMQFGNFIIKTINNYSCT